MDALTSCSYPELLDTMRETAQRERRGGLRNRALDHMRQHRGALMPIESLVNYLGPITKELGSDTNLAASLREAAEDHERLAKALWSLANDMRPVRVLEAAE